MRVCVTRSTQEEVDGIELGAFQVGLAYDVPAALATYLITSGFADPVMDWPALEEPAPDPRRAVSLSRLSRSPTSPLPGGATARHRAVARAVVDRCQTA